MAEIPSDLASSAAQAGFQAREVGRARAARAAGQAQAAVRQAKSADELEVTVEISDDNTKVSPDAEGSGSQGRSDEEATPDQGPPDADIPVPGLTTDEDGQQHLDLQV